MEIYALDKNFNLVAVNIPYYNLQWTRRYYEPGEFEVQIDIKVYRKNWAYIASSDRPELAMVQSVKKLNVEGMVELSGFFYEQKLDDRVCFPRFKGMSSFTESLANRIFEAYKGDLPIVLKPNARYLGNKSTANFSDDELGKKLYRMLKLRELSYKVRYDHVRNVREFTVWQGKDRTQGNKEGNPFYVFSTLFGNVSNVEVNRDESAYKNVCIVPAAKVKGKETVTVTVDWSHGRPKKYIVLDRRSTQKDDDQTDQEFKDALYEDGAEKLNDLRVINEISVDSEDTSGYLVEYDLGDKCDLLIPELEIDEQVRIIEVREVFKSSGHTVSLQFDF